MTATKITKNSIYYLEAFVTDTNGDGVSGLSLAYKIYKSSDNSLLSSGVLADEGSGLYQSNYTFAVLGQYRVIYITPTSYSDEIETILVEEQVAQELSLLRVLGLVQENYRIFNPVYDRGNNMTSALIKIYSSASDVDTDTSPIAQYRVSATYDGKNRMTNYKVKKL